MAPAAAVAADTLDRKGSRAGQEGAVARLPRLFGHWLRSIVVVNAALLPRAVEPIGLRHRGELLADASGHLDY